MTWKELFEEYRSGRKVMKKDTLVIMVLIGILIFVILLPTNQKDSLLETQKEKEISDDSESSSMEQRLEAFLETVDGIGTVKVLIYRSNDDESVYGMQKSKKITGVIISAEGAENTEVKMMIEQLVRALFHLEYSEIEVFPMKRAEKVISKRGDE